jgi:hypothetical protein
MSRIRTIGLAFVAVFALSAMAAAVAQAEPEFKPKGGKFPVAFSSAGTSETFLETEKHGKIKCTGLTSSGELKSAREAGKIEVKFTGCKSEKFGAGECKTKGKAKGEIVTEKLKAKPVFIEGKTKAKEERGLDVSPEAGGKFSEFECASLLGTEVLKVEGAAGKNSVIGRIAAAEVGAQREKVVITFKETAGKQEPKQYEEPAGTLHEDFLETEGISGPEPFAFEPSGEKAVETITYAGKETVELT